MHKEILNVHKALAELKILDDRIIKAIKEGNYVAANKHSNKQIKGIEIEDYKKIMTGGYDKVKDLVARRTAIKKAVVLSNAKTEVAVNGVKYTVAEAIEMRNHGIVFDELLLQELGEQYRRAQLEIARNNAEIDKRAENYVVSCYGSKEKVESAEMEESRKTFVKNNTFELLDPLKILEKMEELEEKISKFKSEIDSVLSVSNAVTEIEISY